MLKVSVVDTIVEGRAGADNRVEHTGSLYRSSVRAVTVRFMYDDKIVCSARRTVTAQFAFETAARAAAFECLEYLADLDRDARRQLSRLGLIAHPVE